ncbi:MAG TPA: lantibiotic dehydratase [Bdellovibrionota bacterium]|nr:lantibiotic dehydratase [Bdellovibrionota bacterium]
MTFRIQALREQAAARFEAETRGTRGELRNVLANPRIQEGILLSSESLYEGVKRYLAAGSEGEGDSTKQQRQLERSAIEHLARAACKTTPRGLLCGIGVARWSDRKGERVSEPPGPRRRTLLTLSAVRKLAGKMSAPSALWQHVRCRSGTALQETGDAPVAAVAHFLEAVASRRATAREVIDAVWARMGKRHERQDLVALYHRLCEQGILIGRLEIPFERRDGLGFLIEWLEKIVGCAGEGAGLAGEWVTALTAIRELLHQIDREPDEAVAARFALYEEVRRRYLELLGEVAKLSLDRLLYVELTPKGMPTTVDAATRKELERVIQASHALTGASGFRHDPRVAAREYLPKVEGFPQAPGDVPLASLLACQELPVPLAKNIVITGKERRLAQLLCESLESGKNEVDLGETDLVESATDAPPWNDWFGEGVATFQFAGELLVMNPPGDQPFTTLARYEDFHGDEELISELRRHAEWLKSQADPQAGWADVLTQSFTITDTATAHGRVFDDCLEVGAVRSEGQSQSVIPLEELWIRVEESRASLVRKRGAEERFQRLLFSSARGMGNIRSPLMRFLYIVGQTRSIGLGHWHERALFAVERQTSRLPRVRLGRVVLVKETWRFEAKDLAANDFGEAFETFSRWQGWAEREGLPRYVFVRRLDAYGVRPFFADLRSQFCLNVINTEVRTNPNAKYRFVEMLPAPDQLAYPREGHATQFQIGLRWRET